MIDFATGGSFQENEIDYMPRPYTSHQARDDAKVTDTSPDDVPELVKTITITAEPNEYIVIRRVGGTVAMDSATLGTDRTTYLTYYIPELNSFTYTVSSQFFNSTFAANYCTNDTGEAKFNRTVHVGAPGQTLSVKLYLEVDIPAVVQSYCTWDNYVNYDRFKFIRHGYEE